MTAKTDTIFLDLGDLASEQWGLVTSAQAATVDADPQRLARWEQRGQLQRLGHGVYRISSAPPSPQDELHAAWLVLEPRRLARERRADSAPIVASHRTASRLHRLGDLDADVHEFTTVQRKQSRRPEVRLHRGTIDPASWELVDGLPTTTPQRTVTDLAAAGTDGGHLAEVARDAVVKGLVDVDELQTALNPFAGRYGATAGDGGALLAQFVADADGVGHQMEKLMSFTRAFPETLSEDLRTQNLAAAMSLLERYFRGPEAAALLDVASAYTKRMSELFGTLPKLDLPVEFLREFDRTASDVQRQIAPALAAADAAADPIRQQLQGLQRTMAALPTPVTLPPEAKDDA